MRDEGKDGAPLHIVSLFLRNFRNYEEASFNFSPGTNLILGKNGAGKSNVIEALYILSTSKSFRKAPDRKILRWGSDGYAVKGAFSTERGETEIELRYEGDLKTLTVGGAPEKRISSIIGRVFSVLYFFEDVYLVSGPPTVRRGYLDLVLSTVDPLYLDALQRYLGVLRQKNRYLFEHAGVDGDLISVWNEQLSDYGGYILHRRMALVEFVNSFLDSTEDGGRGSLGFPYRVVYRSAVRGLEGVGSEEGWRDAFRGELARRVERETELRRALYGPHRDDFSFSDGKREVRHFASVGEARLASIVLKVAQAAFYRAARKAVPILLFDDIFLELDAKNLEKVLALIGEDSQKIVTTTEKEKLPEIFRCDCVFHIHGRGEVTWEGRGESTR